MSKKSGTYIEISGKPVPIIMPVPVTVNHFVFCLHAFNIPHYRDKYNPPGHKTVILILATDKHGETRTKGAGVPLHRGSAHMKSSTWLRAKSQELRANLYRTKK